MRTTRRTPTRDMDADVGDARTSSAFFNDPSWDDDVDDGCDDEGDDDVTDAWTNEEDASCGRSAMLTTTTTTTERTDDGSGGGFIDAFESMMSPETTRAGMAIRAHPMYGRLVDAYYDCRRVGADAREAEALERERDAAMMSGRYAVIEDDTEDAMFRAMSCGVGCESMHRDVDVFVRECTHELEAYAAELQRLYDEAERCCDAFEARARKVRKDVARVESDIKRCEGDVQSAWQAPAGAEEEEEEEEERGGSNADGRRDDSTLEERREREEAIRQDLKRKYASSILSLKSEFMKKRRKGKLPDRSTNVLKEWWANNIVWPYPSEEDKRTLIEQTELDSTQVNNWFINFRKRHWIKLFPAGAPPNKEESSRLLKQKFGGCLEKAKEYARNL